ncbi:MAG TPA: response regulator [Anaerolineae bacterium]|nr:response regulator [Anaerolineae bacterium]
MRKHALIVHPDHAICTLLERWVRNEGYLPQSVRRGEEAVRFVRQAHIDLIVLDRHAPDTECSDVILGLLKDPQSARIPIAFANGDHELPILASSRAVH